MAIELLGEGAMPLRFQWLSSRVFADPDDVIGACVDAWNRFVADPDIIAS